ncbi:hypothetical protein CI105_08950 [Candidatus Izimaplasma bacterium ZiA1]|uniref:hypothetical protein n=1 Tax=Candidatus Izimoplasma sp. ZiA1 TaxID=2024899 RepID=UPI000BAA7079|nr:hypothetical protein CI105_08950 [Candidatus Izimaplasma bacterium ZiA1]
MPRDPKMTKLIKEKLHPLEANLKQSLQDYDSANANISMQRIQNLLRSEGYESRLMQNKLIYFEIIMENDNLNVAISGLEGILKKVSGSSRMFLEANSLLTICHLRKGDAKYKKHMRRTIKLVRNITSEKKRKEFHSYFLQRIEDEMLIRNLIENHEKSDNKEAYNLAIEMLKNNKSENDMYLLLGSQVDNSIQVQIENNRNIYYLDLDAKDIKLLPLPPKLSEKHKVGKRLRKAIGKTIWKKLCIKGEDFDTLTKKGLEGTSFYMGMSLAIALALDNLEIGNLGVKVSLIALSLRISTNVFCEMFAPTSIMSHR